MQNTSSGTIRLTRVNPDLNMARFYEISIQPTLFGEVAIVRNWGRIGSWGQEMMVTLPDEAQAMAALRSLERQKQRRGYRSWTLSRTKG
jgi:predicted DNA-binding WGR domain protein